MGDPRTGHNAQTQTPDGIYSLIVATKATSDHTKGPLSGKTPPITESKGPLICKAQGDNFRCLLMSVLDGTVSYGDGGGGGLPAWVTGRLEVREGEFCLLSLCFALLKPW